ncbi:MAG: class A beta-lactamase-related serine hydrolase [Candidatus Omnitrophica bacterium]|nr:class A beta-lactamase-related serine hydrolase [Candidatus Omnitrophota bacterium]
MKNKKILAVALGVAFTAAAAYFSWIYLQDLQEKIRQHLAEKMLLERKHQAWVILRQTVENEMNSFNGDAGIIIKDLKNNWEIDYQKDKLFPSASLAKIPIMAACFQAIRDAKLSLNDTIVLKASCKVPGSGRLKNMPSGTPLTVEELLELMITESDNTAANMIIGLLGFDYLNSYFKENGLEKTNLSRKMMDFRCRKQGIENYTTAEDITSILEKIYKKKFINAQISGQCLRILKDQKINDRIPKKLPQDAEVAHKTGLENNVCHDAGIVFTEKGDFLICVLTRHPGRSGPAKRFISDIALNTYKYYQQF